MKNIELLAPAGNFEKIKTALFFGADAVYVGGKSFSLRSYASNFDNEELTRATEYVHNLGKKIYVAVNIFARNSDFDEAKKYFIFLESIGVDAAIITDLGLISIAQKYAKKLPIHISTQANTLNKYAVDFYRQMGAERVVLARELPLKDIREIHDFCDIELEAFVHGAMCISYSGRCLLSNYLSDRDSNRGECVQSCRWNYEIREKSKGGDYLEVHEDGRGTYFMNSKDLNMIEHLKDLADSGVMSFKIEGRMKSEYYLATVVGAYRRAIDYIMETGRQDIPTEIVLELDKAAHRKYTKAYYLGDNENTVNYDNSQSKGSYEFIGVIKDYESGENLATIEMRNRFKVGDELEILSPDESFNKKFTVEKIFNNKGEELSECKIVQEIVKINCPHKISKGSILRRIR